MIKAIIFDCFGVIYPDTLALIERYYIALDDPRHQHIRDLQKRCNAGYITKHEFLNQAAELLGISRRTLDAKLQEFQGADWELLEYIKQLKQSYKTAILSNVSHNFVRRIFDKKRPIEDYFDAVVMSADIGVLKPDPRAYQAVAARLNVQTQDCVFIDDQLDLCKGARAVGMQAILYEDFNQFKQKLKQILQSST